MNHYDPLQEHGPQSAAAFHFIYMLASVTGPFMTKSVCRWVFAGAPSCVSSLSWREAGKEFMEGRQPALCVPGLFVTSPPVCALCKWAGGWEGRLHGKLLVLIQHVEQGRRGVLFNKATPPPQPLCQVIHTHKHTHEQRVLIPCARWCLRTNITGGDTKMHT